MITVIRTEADHPFNHSDDEVLGKVSGGFSLSKQQCTCSVCGAGLEHGDTVTVYCRVTCPSIHHRWTRTAYYCIDCEPNDLGDVPSDARVSGGNEALVTGTLRSKGYRPWDADKDSDKLRYQDGKWAEFAATRLEDRNLSPTASATVTDVGGNQYSYNPDAHGPTVPVPASVLSRLAETSTISSTSDATFKRASDNPVMWATQLLLAYDSEYEPSCKHEA